MATVKSGAAIPEIAHGASYLYTCVLSFVLSFMGNKVVAAVFLQLILQITALAFFYFAVRRLAGRMAAVCVVLVTAFMPGINSEIFVLSPETLYFLLYAAGLCLIGCCVRKKSETGTWIGTVLTGIYTGILGYLDISGWTLVLFMVTVCAAKPAGKNTDEITAKRKRLKTAIIQLVLYVVIAVTAMAGCIWADALASGSSFGRIWDVWLELYRNRNGMFVYPSGGERLDSRSNSLPVCSTRKYRFLVP